MAKFFLKFGVLFFMLNTIFQSAYIFGSYANILFYGLMGIFTLFIIIGIRQYVDITLKKPFVFLLLINLANLLHLLIFDQTTGAAIYFVAKLVIFFIISASIVYNRIYYEDMFFRHFIYIGIFFLFASLLFSQDFSAGYKGIIGNRNEFALLFAMVVGVYYISKEKLNIQDYMWMAVLVTLILISGSRNALFGLFFAWIIKNGLSWRMTLVLPLFIGIYFALDALNIETTITRLQYEEDVFFDRRMEFYFAFETFKNKMFTGYGLDHYAYIDPALVPRFFYESGHKMMAHNSYLAALVQYGVVFAFFIFSILIYIIAGIYFAYMRNSTFAQNIATRVYIFILSFTMISSIFESHMFGVNALHGFMFWFSLSILNYKLYFVRKESIR